MLTAWRLRLRLSSLARCSAPRPRPGHLYAANSCSARFADRVMVYALGHRRLGLGHRDPGERAPPAPYFLHQDKGGNVTHDRP